MLLEYVQDRLELWDRVDACAGLGLGGVLVMSAYDEADGAGKARGLEWNMDGELKASSQQRSATFGPKVIRPRMVCGTPVPVGFIMMGVDLKEAVFVLQWVRRMEVKLEVGRVLDIYSWLSLVPDIQWGKSDSPKLMSDAEQLQRKR